MHDQPSPLAGKTVRIKVDATHPQVANFAGAEYRVEDWWDRVSGGSWMFADGNPACLVYAMRTGFCKERNIPTDDEVLYSKIGPFGHLVHITEIEAEEKAIVGDD